MQPRQSWQDAYDAQLATWRWIKTPGGRRWMLLKYTEEVHEEPFPEELKRLSASLYGVEPAKLRTAAPYYVSGEMCEVVAAAKESFAPEPIYPTDFLTPNGLLYYEQPFPLRDRNGTEILMRGFSWTPIIAEAAHDIMEWPEDSDAEMLKLLGDRSKDGQMDGIALTLYAEPNLEKWHRLYDPAEFGNAPPLLPIHITPWWFSMTFEGNEVDTQGNHTAVEEWWKLIQTTLRLMQQRMTVRHQQKPTRPQRREAEREGHDGKDVIVVRLRREQSQPADGHIPSEANYSHRFIVGGHWRNQWYPSINGHRQIFISPYVKGDEDLPLVIKPRRVYTWTR